MKPSPSAFFSVTALLAGCLLATSALAQTATAEPAAAYVALATPTVGTGNPPTLATALLAPGLSRTEAPRPARPPVLPMTPQNAGDSPMGTNSPVSSTGDSRPRPDQH